MTRNLLISYASAFGSTAEVAHRLEHIFAEDFATELRPIDTQPPVAEFDAVVLGSAVQYATWLPEAKDFVTQQRSVLSTRPVAVFSVHIQNLGNTAESRQRRSAYLSDIRPLINPLAEGYFAGRFDRQAAKLLLPGLVARFVPTLDFRKWPEIESWANATCLKINAALAQELARTSSKQIDS